MKHLSKLEQQALTTFVGQLHQRYKDSVESVRLFGSRARGEGNEDSDLDVLVLLEMIDLKTKNAIWDIANDVFLDTWINISPLVMTVADFETLVKHERLIALEIRKDGISL